MAQKKEPDVSTPSGAYTRMAPRWELIDTLLGGTEAMRSAGRTHTPQHDNETNKAYEDRLAQTVLLNAVEDTLKTLVGRPFADPTAVNDDVPSQIVDLLDDVDLQGSALQPFCRGWFRDGWAKGFSHVLVEMPLVEPKLGPNGEPLPRTLADDRSEGKRPYWIHIRPENIIAAYGELVSGKWQPTHVRILETTVERDGWGERAVERIRVLEPGTWELYAYDGQKKEWVLEDSGATGLERVPLVTFYTVKPIGYLEAKPALTDLAYLNVTHWQSSSDQRSILTVARFPILAASGIEDVGKVVIGPRKFLSTTDAQGKWYYVEHSGAAIESGAKDLESLENQMSAYGSEFLRAKPGSETATARALDSAESTSDLAATVMDFQDCVAEVLQLTAEYMHLEEGGTVKIKGDFVETGAEAPELDTLLKMRAARDISRPALLAEMTRRKVLSPTFDAEDDKELLDRETPAETAGMFDRSTGEEA